jgi:hypothetical protein
MSNEAQKETMHVQQQPKPLLDYQAAQPEN